ncbi:ubiquinol oxidase subunit II [Microbulbifer celer]|uniref:Ubiquinol oxidase subunit 2 n=1 Tax=Microbulbifer celer TaxID=435905 RepID=A0ABW3U690_9GAMM|nr:ubiquinol oxidase subunit II [Microbulbifer celer]UFN56682.1 ubiquinol oxidase subunit II [Microbulbifer celer]
MFIRSLKTAALSAAVLALAGCEGGVLDPKGQVGVDEKSLIIIATVLMLLVVIPVIAMTLYFAWKYREGREHEIYAPKWAHSGKIETTVWLIPVVIVVILGAITWRSTHALDPYQPLEHERDPLTVEVVSLNWKWLFIYPEQGVASVNELVIPTDVPVQFKITSESTMNSFFIPQLGSQIYSMAGMETKLHLIANEPGTFEGFSANYSGAGFSDMHFDAIAMSDAGFEDWVTKLKSGNPTLDSKRYAALAKPSEDHPIEHFGAVSDGLFHQIIHKYMQNYNTWNQAPSDTAAHKGTKHGSTAKHHGEAEDQS